jgi:hypothetical protein
MFDNADGVHLQRGRGFAAKRGNIRAMRDGWNEGRNSVARVLEQITATGFERPLIHPDQRCFQGLDDRRWSSGGDDQVAAADVQFAVQHQCYR